ncbi:MAG: hypothetical protein ACRBDL_08430 [Alphaproteobacteria bacterium]
MPKKQAAPVEDLNTAIDEVRSIVLKLPSNCQSLKKLFDDQEIKTKEARMTPLKRWARPPYQDGKKYGEITTQSIQDFQDKLDKIETAGKADFLKIEYAGYILNYSASLLRNAQAQMVENFNNQAGGDVLYDGPDKAIGFPRLEYDKENGLRVVVPYIDKDEPDTLKLKEMEYKPLEGHNGDAAPEMPDAYLDNKMHAAGDHLAL